jgi:hypothetical protein
MMKNFNKTPKKLLTLLKARERVIQEELWLIDKLIRCEKD